MKTDELRQAYLDFFVSKGHRLCASDVLVPRWDKSVLFTPAGMNPFKDHFLGRVELEFTRATSCQKCLRTGDIDNVGRTAYHHTFFEMLGNFSFGDYFKREAINWAWEFLTSKRWLGLAADRLYVTVYLDDDEAAGIWQSDVGLTPDRIKRMDEHDNFWPAGAPTLGPDGVCGPCSEIYYLPPGSTRDVEIWNLVFTQFNREGDPPNNLKPLPSKNIDTGMGLERTAAQLQGVDTNYHIDILRPIVEAAAEVCGVKYDPQSEQGRRLRRITDHVRACSFAIHENVHPGPAKQEYVVRRLLRRAVLDGHQLGLREPFLHRLVGKVAEMMHSPYPELSETVDRVARVMRMEEQAFLGNLDAGLARIERIFSAMQSRNSQTVPGGEAAELYQTFGVPPELFEQIAVERGALFDWSGFQAAMKEHGLRSGVIAEGVMGEFGPLDEIKRDVKTCTFRGYETTRCEASVVGLAQGDARVERLVPEHHLDDQQIVVLSESPFYAESGGQVGDTGLLIGSAGQFRVEDTQRDGELIVHYGRMESGALAIGDRVRAEVDETRRQAIRRAHSATHVLHHALQQELGSHAVQRGSKVTADWLRFDFSNMAPVSPEQLQRIESRMLQKVAESAAVTAEILPLATARTRGAMMLFGEKYPDPVRMISMGEFSRELCGGTHVGNTREIGLLEIVAEEGVSAGTRRIEVLTGDRAKELQEFVQATTASLARQLETSPAGLAGAVADLTREVKDLRKQLESGKAAGPRTPTGRTDTACDNVAQRNQLREMARALNVPLREVGDKINALLRERGELQQQIAAAANQSGPTADELIRNAEYLDNKVRLIVQELPPVSPTILRQLVDEIRSKAKPVAVFFATANGPDKVQLVAGVSADLISQGVSAGQWVKEIAPLVGGGGGGKPDFAQAGGKQPENIRPALRAAVDFLKSSLQV